MTKIERELFEETLLTCKEFEFIDTIFKIRGTMGIPFRNSLKTIYRTGIPRMRIVCAKKQMGIRNIEQRCTLSKERQEAFCDWMDTKKWKASRNEIDLWDAS